jgi:hypothetical protein
MAVPILTLLPAVETLKKLNFEALEHPLYSSHLDPSDYHLFSPLKQVIRDYQFMMDQQQKGMENGWLVS